MKGTVVKCLKDIVIRDYDLNKWKLILEESGLSPSTLIMLTSDIEDQNVIKMFHSTCKILDIDFVTLCDKFGDYWSNGYVDKMYNHYYARHKSAQSFLLDLDALHKIITDTITNATPPQFDYQIINDKKIIMTYKSKRNLMDLFVGLTKGLGKHYNENLILTRLENNQLSIESK